MPITNIVSGDLIALAKEGKYAGILHGCNCFCTMGSGIAPQIAEAFPEARIADNNTEEGSKDKLGTFSVAFNPEHHLWVFNMYTQFGYGGHKKFGQPDLDYDALYKSFALLNKTYGGHINTIGLPMVGAGLAFGHWQAIELLINLATPDLDLELVVYNG